MTDRQFKILTWYLWFILMGLACIIPELGLAISFVLVSAITLGLIEKHYE